MDTPRERFRALVVDDDSGVRESVGLVIQTLGHQVIQASSGREAFEMVSRVEVHFGILDVHVCEDDGLQILRELRSLVRGLPAIFMTGHATAEIERQAKALGAHRVLHKPLEMQLLRNTDNALVTRELSR